MELLLSTTADHKSLEGRREISDAIVFSRTDVVVHGPVTGGQALWGRLFNVS